LTGRRTRVRATSITTKALGMPPVLPIANKISFIVTSLLYLGQ
jgi:hypothetical protein